MRVKRDTLFIDNKLGGISTLEVIVDTKIENGVYDPKILKKLSQN